jgi:flagellar hook protein FlgE
MDVIGNNIANVNTFGFKKARAAFRDQFYATMRGSTEAGNVYGGGNPSQVGYGSALHSVDVDFSTASGAPTGNGMDVMINGNGFFMVGTFDPMGYATTSNNGAIAAAAGNDGIQNLMSLYYTRIGIFNVDGQGNFVDSARNYVYGFSINEATGKVGSPLYTGAAGDPARLEVLTVPWAYFDENGDIITDSATGKAIRVDWEINAGPPNQYAVDNDETDPLLAGPSGRVGDGANPTGPNGEVAAYIAPMKLTNISIGDNGIITGVYQDTEEVITIGQIAIADVPNPYALENTVNGYYKAKNNTGVVTAEIPGEGSTGQLSAGRLEMANVDLAQEFTEMITTQRGFQANGRIITVTDEMLAELVNLKR